MGPVVQVDRALGHEGRENLQNLEKTDVNSNGGNAVDRLPILPASPDEAFYLQNITELNLSGQGLKSIPDTLNFANLLVLNLSNNEITCLPLTLKTATHLRVLNVSRNKLTEFPSVIIDNLGVLKTIDVSYNAISSLPRPACVQHLEEFFARSCHLNEFPLWILLQRHCLEVLDLSGNRVFEHLRKIDRMIFHSSCGSLKKINFSNTCLNDKCLQLFQNFTALEYLDISNYSNKYCNRIQSCDDLLLPSLKVIKITDVGISINPELKNFQLLEKINMAKNPLSWIDSKLVSESLKVLVAPHCFICSLPDSIGEMVNLEYLNLSHNDVSELPLSFSSLVNLKHLDLYRNSFLTFPTEVEPLKKLECFDICLNHVEPPVLPLGNDGPTYEDLRKALRAVLSENRTCGPVEPPPAVDIYQDDNSETSESDEEVLPFAFPEVNETTTTNTQEDWDNLDTNVIYAEQGFADLSFDRSSVTPYTGPDTNLYFMQYLHLVPERIRQSPFYYHRIDTTTELHSDTAKANLGDTVEGQFDD